MTTATYPQMMRPPILYGRSADCQYTLPPMLPGEECIPLQLVKSIRDGQRSLETEDVLVNAIVDVLRMHGGPRIEEFHWPSEAEYLALRPGKEGAERATVLFWTPPAEDDPNRWSMLLGYELLFKSNTGMPFSESLLNAGYTKTELLTQGELAGLPRAVKTPPVMELPFPQYECPFTTNSPQRDAFRRRGYRSCASQPFVNLVAWQRHLNETHAEQLRDLYLWYGGGSVEKGQQLIEDAMVKHAEQRLAIRRGADPRLSQAPVVPEE